jgi:hypothetical protein
MLGVRRRWALQSFYRPCGLPTVGLGRIAQSPGRRVGSVQPRALLVPSVAERAQLAWLTAPDSRSGSYTSLVSQR